MVGNHATCCVVLCCEQLELEEETDEREREKKKKKKSGVQAQEENEDSDQGWELEELSAETSKHTVTCSTSKLQAPVKIRKKRLQRGVE